MLFLCWTDSSDSPGLGHDLTVAFVTVLEEGLSIALGYNDTLHGIIIHWNIVQLECNTVFGYLQLTNLGRLY